MTDRAEVLGEGAAHVEDATGETSAESGAASAVFEEAPGGEKGIEVDDPFELAAAVVRHHEDVLVGAGCIRERADRLVEDAVDVGDEALDSAALPVVPAEMVDVVCRHEDDEEQVELVPLLEPQRDLDLLLRSSPNEVEVEISVLAEGEAMVEHERAEALADLGEERARMRRPLVALRRVEAGDHAAVDLRARAT